MAKGKEPKALIEVDEVDALKSDVAAVQRSALGVSAQAEVSRVVREVEASLVIARRFPRDRTRAEAGILTECERYGIAEAALYSYPRAGEQVSGLTIRMAEAIARHWGNLEYGFRELSREGGRSEVESFAWDLETNVRARRTFTVEHKIHRKDKATKYLTDPRDVYEMVANQAQRRVRACILELIPSDLIETIQEQVQKTLRVGPGTPLSDRVRAAVIGFQKFGITQEHLERRLGHEIAITTAEELTELIAIFNGLKTGEPREAYFDLGAPKSPGGPAGQLTAALSDEEKFPFEKEKAK